MKHGNQRFSCFQKLTYAKSSANLIDLAYLKKFTYAKSGKLKIDLAYLKKIIYAKSG